LEVALTTKKSRTYKGAPIIRKKELKRISKILFICFFGEGYLAITCCEVAMVAIIGDRRKIHKQNEEFG